MAYEVFKKKSIRVEQPALSIVPDGRIALNAASARVLMDAGVKSAVLLWDEAKSKLAVKAAPKTDKNAYAVSILRGGASGTLTAKSFLNHIGWTARARKMLFATWDPKERMLEVTLPREFVTSDRVKDAKRGTKTGV